MKNLFDYSGIANSTDIERLIADGADVNVRNSKGHSSFMMASCFGYPEAAEALIKAGANIDGQDNQGNTALMLAAYSGIISIVKFLLDKGCDMQIRDKNGGSAATAVLENTSMPEEQSVAMIRFFLDQGYQPNDQDEANPIFYNVLTDWRESKKRTPA